jgi:four helix bundle protein
LTIAGGERRSRDFKSLQIWQKGHQLTLRVYHVTSQFPREETYGLVSQIRRCCVSIPANIAEGCGRGGAPELARFVEIARGSASELEYYFLLVHDLQMIDRDLFNSLSADLEEIERMLSTYRHRLLT